MQQTIAQRLRAAALSTRFALKQNEDHPSRSCHQARRFQLTTVPCEALRWKAMTGMGLRLLSFEASRWMAMMETDLHLQLLSL